MTSLRHGTSDTRRKNGFGIDIVYISIYIYIFIYIHGCGIVLVFFLAFFFVVLGLSRLVSGETTGEMQVSFGSDVQNCCRRQILTFVSVFSVSYGTSVLSLSCVFSMCQCVWACFLCGFVCFLCLRAFLMCFLYVWSLCTFLRFLSMFLPLCLPCVSVSVHFLRVVSESGDSC